MSLLVMLRLTPLLRVDHGISPCEGRFSPCEKSEIWEGTTPAPGNIFCSECFRMVLASFDSPCLYQLFPGGLQNGDFSHFLIIYTFGSSNLMKEELVSIKWR